MKIIDGQHELPLHRVVQIEDDIVMRQPNITRAIVVCADMAGLEDKQAASAAGLDPASWSKVKSGQAYFPQTRYTGFQQRCGNWLPLQWMARDAGFKLVRLESEMERQARTNLERAEKAEAENALLRNLIQGKAT